MMNMPRCGVRDIDSMGSIARRRKRYAASRSTITFPRNLQGGPKNEANFRLLTSLKRLSQFVLILLTIESIQTIRGVLRCD